jgi:hypothetical protein
MVPRRDWRMKEVAMAGVASGVTFAVDDVPLGPRALRTVESRRAIEAVIGPGAVVESWSTVHEVLMCCPFHGFVGAVHVAYALHLPLVMSPDHIWLLIAQGLAQHIRLDPEAWRPQVTSDSGKRVLTVHDNGLARNAPGNRWNRVFQLFVQQLESESPEVTRLLTPSFSTTGPTERLAYAVAAMDALEPYYAFRVVTICGIPQITLEGTPDDWRSLRARAERVRAFGLEWWCDELLPVLDRFVDAANGRVAVSWWRGFYKDEGGSGGPQIHGHVRVFFPYLRVPLGDGRWQFVRNGAAAGSGPDAHGNSRPRPAFSALLTDWLPSSLSRVPFAWEYMGSPINMEAVAGFVGISQDLAPLRVRPEIGWAVRQVAAPAAG